MQQEGMMLEVLSLEGRNVLLLVSIGNDHVDC